MRSVTKLLRRDVATLDRELARLGRGAGALRLQLGEALERLAVQGGHHACGFSSLAAYALERCERSGRWAMQARTVARRVAELPRLRAAMASGERLCWSVWHSWHAGLGKEVAYSGIYARDRYRCSSPVCTRGDVTPHHLRFRSHGGDDTAENLTALCVWCHLEGVHGGRIRALPPARASGWTLGVRPILVVHGRRKVELDHAAAHGRAA